MTASVLSEQSAEELAFSLNCSCLFCTNQKYCELLFYLEFGASASILGGEYEVETKNMSMVSVPVKF